MNRIIINNYTSISDMDALAYVMDVVNEGTISNDGKQYCCSISYGDISVFSGLLKNGHKFDILRRVEGTANHFAKEL